MERVKRLLWRLVGRRYKVPPVVHPEPSVGELRRAEGEKAEMLERIRRVADRLQVEMDVYRRERHNHGFPGSSH